jgi:hypothetical protein
VNRCLVGKTVSRQNRSLIRRTAGRNVREQRSNNQKNNKSFGRRKAEDEPLVKWYEHRAKKAKKQLAGR